MLPVSCPRRLWSGTGCGILVGRRCWSEVDGQSKTSCYLERSANGHDVQEVGAATTYFQKVGLNAMAAAET